MILSPTDSVLLSVGPLTIYWYGLIVTSALAVGYLLCEYLLKKRSFSRDLYEKVLFIMVLSSIIGARLYHVFVLNTSYYLQDPSSIVRIWEGGIAIHGAILGGLLSVWYLSRRYAFSFMSFMDAVAPALMLGQALGRWGNFFNQEAYGAMTDVPWAIYINATSQTHHPTFFYESILNFCAAVILFVLFQKTEKRGLVFAVYLGLYGLNRMLIESLRVDSSYLFGYKIAFIVAVISVIVSLLLSIRILRQKNV